MRLVQKAFADDNGFDEHWIPLLDGKDWELYLWTDEETGHKVGQLYPTKIDGGVNLTADQEYWITIYNTSGKVDKVELI